MSAGGWDPKTEEGFALLVGKDLEPIFEAIKAKLPAGTHFGLLICVPGVDANSEGRVVALCTDREKVGVAAATWILNAVPFGR